MESPSPFRRKVLLPVFGAALLLNVHGHRAQTSPCGSACLLSASAAACPPGLGAVKPAKPMTTVDALGVAERAAAMP
jgi:hypothetical protein